MAGIFDYLNSTVQSPMFLAGAGLLSGEGFGGAMQGMQMGQRNQALQRQQAQEQQRQQAFEGLFADPNMLKGVPMGAVNIARAAGPEAGLPMLAGMLPKPRDPLDERYKLAQIKNLEQRPAGGELPSNVREWQFFNALPADQKTQYLTMKRAEKYLDTETGFVRPDPMRPGQTIGAPIPKEIAGAEQQKVVGRETGERQMAAPKAMAAIQSADAKTDLVLNTLGEARSKVSRWSTGIGGALLRNLPETQAMDLRETIKTLVANSGFEELQSMRDNSPTGGALGQVAVQELEMLQKVRSSLEQSQTMGQLLKNMDTFEAFVKGSKERRRKAFEMTYGAGGNAMQMPQQPATGGGLRSGNYRYNPQTGELEPQ